MTRSNSENRINVSGAEANIAGNNQASASNESPPTLNFSSGFSGLSDANSSFNRNRTDSFTASTLIYHGKHNFTIGGEFRKQGFNDYFQQNPRGGFAFTGAASSAGVLR